MPIPIEPLELVIALAVVALGSAVQATVGFGLALIAAPVLLLIYPAFVPGPLIASGVVMVFLVAHRDRFHIDLLGLRYALIGRVAGTLLAGVFLAIASAELFDVAFGALVLLGAVISALGIHISPSPKSATAAGALSGLMGTISSVGGPPLALLYQAQGAARLRGTLAGFFIFGGALTLVVLAAVGRFGWEEVKLALLLTPASVLGFFLSVPLKDRVSEKAIGPLVIVLSVACGIAVLWRALG